MVRDYQNPNPWPAIILTATGGAACILSTVFADELGLAATAFASLLAFWVLRERVVFRRCVERFVHSYNSAEREVLRLLDGPAIQALLIASQAHMIDLARNGPYLPVLVSNQHAVRWSARIWAVLSVLICGVVLYLRPAGLPRGGMGLIQILATLIALALVFTAIGPVLRPRLQSAEEVDDLISRVLIKFSDPEVGFKASIATTSVEAFELLSQMIKGQVLKATCQAKTAG